MEEPLTTYFMEWELSPYQAYNIKAWNVPIGPILSYNTSTLGLIFADSTGLMFFSKKLASLQ